MRVPDQRNVRNLLLKALPAEAFQKLTGDGSLIELPARHVLVEADQPNEYVCFIEDGLASMVAANGDDEAVEVGHIGLDGMSGLHVLLRTDTTPNRTFVQVAGSGVRVSVKSFSQVLAEFPAADELFLKYMHCCDIQLAQSALANGRYNMHERLARWLLMCHDRLSGNDLPLTHELLAIMLGVRRAGVTNELHVIEGLRAIRSTRANVRILDRDRLEEIAAGCYGVPEREYQRLIGLPIRRPTNRHS
ncbi:Crp/Fnr family transcriptional regulator [Rhizobium lentis]|uniref:Crp/Fnr family transcriptional regulator n=1 Tax=Rhizobium lentis TaxID=1138194 RepID=A0A9Q3MGT8_9HYPH|nr:Crp/Fnr family transcriptional regulator [Rhizobium lentis]MBX5010539.1 Crp/Fnr family transcriptional regulator [Rhizobium lentis]MBX5025599.1 Crp/Fnr family transcriptional regulator [Rhizobium lentis]MBX5038978.1 Crp/Fnr family transcriptional regulator [Rhizobium lentis]MBX5056319.1 Crp/Fnr family transcriptional regulator [Rhizobium lentis]MBX5068641.1 Crp/Fnr family transcriptional regulator [Rhizobium lentis]